MIRDVNSAFSPDQSVSNFYSAATRLQRHRRNAQSRPPARHDKTVLSVSCQAVWIESRDRLAKSGQFADRSPSSRGV